MVKQQTHGIKNIDSFNNFISKQKLQQALKSWSNFNLTTKTTTTTRATTTAFLNKKMANLVGSPIHRKCLLWCWWLPSLGCRVSETLSGLFVLLHLLHLLLANHKRDQLDLVHCNHLLSNKCIIHTSPNPELTDFTPYTNSVSTKLNHLGLLQFSCRPSCANISKIMVDWQLCTQLSVLL